MMDNKSFLLQVIEDIKNDNSNSIWRGTITSWIKC